MKPTSAILLAGLAQFALPNGVSAAEMSIVGQGRAGQSVVLIIGELNSGDDDRFKTILGDVKRAVVFLESPGGSLVAGLGIGNEIRRRGYSTAVAQDKVCASAFALAWLGGALRFGDPSARIGFHAAFIQTNGQPIESGMANALVGAYANALGLPTAAVMFITAAAPKDMNWLSLASAKNIGVEAAFAPTTIITEIAVQPRTTTAVASNLDNSESFGRPPPNQITGNASPVGQYYSVQVGILTSDEEAREYIDNLKSERSNIVGKLYPHIIKVIINGRDLYRARFMASSLAASIYACSRLLEQGSKCFVVRHD